MIINSQSLANICHADQSDKNGSHIQLHSWMIKKVVVVRENTIIPELFVTFYSYNEHRDV